jgi:hypothetical protein
MKDADRIIEILFKLEYYDQKREDLAFCTYPQIGSIGYSFSKASNCRIL